MQVKTIFLLCWLVMFFTNYSKNKDANNPGHFEFKNIQELHNFYYWLVSESETYYDNGTGHFGQESFGYSNHDKANLNTFLPRRTALPIQH